MVHIFFLAWPEALKAVLSISMQRFNTLMKSSKGFSFLYFLNILSLYSALERGVFKVSFLL